MLRAMESRGFAGAKRVKKEGFKGLDKICIRLAKGLSAVRDSVARKGMEDSTLGVA